LLRKKSFKNLSKNLVEEIFGGEPNDFETDFLGFLTEGYKRIGGLLRKESFKNLSENLVEEIFQSSAFNL
jgi:hypothetical protein